MFGIVIVCKRKSKKGFHPAVFPVALPLMCIKLSGVPVGSVIVDPFMGIGSTLIACKRLGMQGIGFEISKNYCNEAYNRINFDRKKPNLISLRGDRK